MRKYIIAFILCCTGGILYLQVAILPKEYFVSMKKGTFDVSNFVSIKDNKFRLDGKNFYPLAVNYVAGLHTDGNELWPRPSIDYTVDTSHQCLTKETCIKEVRADMQLIRQLGFNAVRVVGIGEIVTNDTDHFSDLYVRAYAGHNEFKGIKLSDTASYIKYFGALEELFSEINNAGLKVILLLRMRPDILTTDDFLAKITHYFKNDATILAYDLYNEPLYFDKERSKKDVYETTKRWEKICKANSPRHLITIGMEGIREVHAWDPNVVNVDFLSFHPYEYEPEQVRNEMYWYGKYVKRPWIIGETAIPADGDSVSYDEQKLFADKTLKQSYNCGAIGYSWWQYKDVHWPKFHSSYMGVVNRKGETKIGSTNLTVIGTVKPVAEEFKTFDPTAKKDSCICLSNYYNYSQLHDCRIKGRLLDSNSKPLEGGVFLAWNQSWTHSYHTISKPDGTFELLGDFPFYHWMVSACSYTMTRGDILPDTAKKQTDNIPTMNMGDIKIKKLHFGN